MKEMMNSAVSLLEYAAKRYNDRTAFEDKDTSVTFSELRRKSRRLASGLMEKCETGKMSPIIVYLPKSVNSVISFMGIMYASSPYVPIDYAIPMARLEKTVENLRPAAIITDTEGKERVEASGIDIPLLLFGDIVNADERENQIDYILNSVCDLDPAYIMYTSGSTGTPKGVTVSHRGVLDYIRWITDRFPITDKSVIGMQSAFHFDNSVFDMFAALYKGAKTMIIPEILFMYPEKLLEYLAQYKISVIFWVPTVMISAANSGALEKTALPELKLIFFAGEVMPNTQLNIWRRFLPGCVYVNMYGPTEGTDIVTYYVVDREFENHETLPIGIPCANMKAVILNDKNTECGTNEEGELCIGGSGIAMGYWNAPELSCKAFIQNPLNTKYYERLYRTGDLVYKNDEGNIIFLGRADTQIKLRGNRIELGDVESAASAVRGVTGSCAVFDSGKEEIVLFLETSEEIVQRKFKMELKKYLPAYMVPGKIITKKQFPHTPSGKIDRVKLKKEI